MIEFEGHKVTTSRVAVTNAGDGLSEAMAIDPGELALGSTVYVVLECSVAKVRYEPAQRESADLTRVHVLRAGLATLVDERAVRKALREQRRKLDEARGIAELFGEPDDE